MKNPFLLAYKQLEKEGYTDKPFHEIDLLMLDRAIKIRDYMIAQIQNQKIAQKKWKNMLRRKK